MTAQGDRQLTAPDRLFMLLAEGVAAGAAERRPGARHALMLFAAAADLAEAQAGAFAHAESRGWSLLALRRAKGIGPDPEEIADPTLRAAARSALASGHAIVVYGKEIPPDA